MTPEKIDLELKNYQDQIKELQKIELTYLLCDFFHKIKNLFPHLPTQSGKPLEKLRILQSHHYTAHIENAIYRVHIQYDDASIYIKEGYPLKKTWDTHYENMTQLDYGFLMHRIFGKKLQICIERDMTVEQFLSLNAPDYCMEIYKKEFLETSLPEKGLSKGHKL